MRVLFEIDYKNYKENGTVGKRPSARAIIIKDNKIAMVYSKKYDYFKFPGGGIESSETNIDALIREVKEEVGLDVIKESIEEYGLVIRKEKGKVEGILAAVYQDVFGGEVYPSLEEKAANLLYFMIKDHPFADGCKRIAASLFLEFLNRNNALFRDGHKVISDGALVAITLMIAESDPKEKDIMTTMVMNLLSVG